ncbi:MAG: M48 family metallopeptidase [Tepidisphaeraceae bacterium]
MSRFLLLFLFLIWMAWRAESGGASVLRAADLGMFFGLYLFIVGTLGIWSRLLARRVRRASLERGMRYFNRVAFAARTFVPIWFAVGVFQLGWGDAVQRLLGPLRDWPVQMPGALIGVMPPILAWIGLWWSQFPADRALREQTMLVRLDNDLPIFRPPTFWSYLAANLRLQVLFTAVPILLILFVHDVVMIVLWRGFGVTTGQSAAEGIITFASAIAVFIVVPEILTRVLPTQSLPPSPLRQRMEAMCTAHGMKFRDILIWRTQNRLANALVMGVAPRFRYVLLSDLLLTEMTDEQIEAVFAHELGHVVHRHMIWYLVFMKILILALAVIALVLEAQQGWLRLPRWMPPDLVMTLIGFGGFLLAFGFISRRFERQADVFAARTIQRLEGSGLFIAHANPHANPDHANLDDPTTAVTATGLAKTPSTSIVRPPPSHVGPLGAAIFSSALERVAVINNMPLGPRGRWEGGLSRRLGFVMELIGDAANNWLHGSISHRMRALRHMSSDPAQTHRFDRRMARLYVTLVVALLVSATLAWVVR